MYDWDDAYANSAYIADSETLPDQWAEQASAYRKKHGSIELDVAYGEGERQRFDLVWPEGSPQGLAVFVHGGYWMSMDKSFWTHFAEGARSRGWVVCVPGYDLTPEVTVSEITMQVARAIETAAARVQGPVRLAGHSAGGHLVSRMGCEDGPLGHSVYERIDHILSISGLHDLRPLMATKMNETLKLAKAEAVAESPALQTPRKNLRLTAWVGGGERPEFLRQAKLMEILWSGFETQVKTVVDGHHNHFSVLEGLKHAESAITRTFIQG